MVVRRLLLMIGWVRGLRTLEWKEPSLFPPTIRRAWPAVNIFSFGGDPAIVAAVGLLRRCARRTFSFEAREMEPARFSALPILRVSNLFMWKLPSPSDEELFALSLFADATACMILREERLAAFAASIVRNGDVSVSDPERRVILGGGGGGGDPSDFFARKPAWNRFVFGLISMDD